MRKSFCFDKERFQFPLLYRNSYCESVARFDGVFLSGHFAKKHPECWVRPMIRDGRMYEFQVYVGKRLIFILRDSMNLLPSPLDHLACLICP
jgi:hypothetical protein